MERKRDKGMIKLTRRKEKQFLRKGEPTRVIFLFIFFIFFSCPTRRADFLTDEPPHLGSAADRAH